MSVCATCRFFVEAPERNGTTLNDNPPNDTVRIFRAGGSCHCHAPQPLVGGSGTGWADWEWPAMSPADFCGEYQDPEP